MIEHAPEHNYDDPPQGMTPEANAAISQALLLRRKEAAGHMHFHPESGRVEADPDDTPETETPSFGDLPHAS